MIVKKDKTRIKVEKVIQHDLKNLIGIIIMSTRDLGEIDVIMSNRAAQDCLNSIKIATDNVESIIDDCGKDDQVANVGKVISSWKWSLSKICKDIQINEGENWNAPLSNDLLSRILMNLCTNAKESGASLVKLLSKKVKKSQVLDMVDFEGQYKFEKDSEEHLSMVISNSKKVVNAFDQYGVISINDNGSGIDQDTLYKIFAQNNRITKKVDKSQHGLGTHMIKDAIFKVGGILHIETKVGSGTTISVYLPAIENTKQIVIPPSVGKASQKAYSSQYLFKD